MARASSQDKIALRQRGEVVGEIVHFDLEVGSAVAVGVALDDDKSNLRHEMQLALDMMELMRVDEFEVLIAGDLSALASMPLRSITSSTASKSVITSRPAPFTVSFALLKSKISAPKSPVSKSLPLPPISVSPPPRPSSVSLPAKPKI